MSSYVDGMDVLGADDVLDARVAARKHSENVSVAKGYVGGALAAVAVAYAAQAIFPKHKFLGTVGGGVTGFCLGAAFVPMIGVK